MSTQGSRDHENNTSQPRNQQQRQQAFPTANTFPGRWIWRRASAVVNPFVSPLKRRRPRGIKIWHLILLMLLIDAVILWQDFAKNTTQTVSHSTGGGLAPESHSVKQANNMHNLTNHMKYKQLASLYVDHMSLDDKLGQLIVGRFTESDYSPDLDRMINQQHIGGVILFAKQIQTMKQIEADTAKMQSRANLPLLIGT